MGVDPAHGVEREVSGSLDDALLSTAADSAFSFFLTWDRRLNQVELDLVADGWSVLVMGSGRVSARTGLSPACL
jgi:hypothetical protein